MVIFNIILGLITGGILGLINLKLLQRDIVKSATINKEKIRVFFFVSYFRRYMLNGLVLAACLFLKNILFFLGALAGLLLTFYSKVFLVPETK